MRNPCKVSLKFAHGLSWDLLCTHTHAHTYTIQKPLGCCVSCVFIKPFLPPSGRHLRSLQAFVYLLGFVVGFTANRANRLSRSCKVPKFLHPKRVERGLGGGVVGKRVNI